MRNIFLFLKRYDFVILFLFLQSIAITLLVYKNNYHHSVFFNSLQEFSGRIYQNYSNSLYYFSLRKTNDSLLVENAKLRTVLSSAYSLDKTNKYYFGTNSKFKFDYKPAYIINNSIHLRNNYFTLNVGRKQGIVEGMGVITKDGVIGITKRVSENFSLVLSILNGDFKVSVRIVECDEIGSINWEGGNPNIISLNDIPNHVNVKKGQQVVIGPYSHYFPENYPIGKIEDFDLVKGESFYNIDVKLYTKMRNNTEVYAIKRELIEEQLELESLSNE